MAMTTSRLVIAAVLMMAALVGGLSSTIAAQEAAPGATPGAACVVEPRSPDELQRLTGTPEVTAPMGTPATLPDGEPVDTEMTAALEETLRLARACAEAGDLSRLLALYTGDYIVAQVLPEEATPIVPGHAPDDAATLPAGTPAPTAESTVEEARLLPDGRVAARVVTNERIEIVFFAYDEERQIWQIDAVFSVAGEAGTPLAEQPATVAAALADAATQLGVDQAELTVTTVESHDWPDSSLGCPKPGEFYAQVITPGYRIVIQGAGQEMEYHGDETGNVVLCEPS